MKRTLLSLIVIILGLILTGCYTPKKAESQLNKAKENFPSIVAAKTSLWFPCKEIKTATDSSAYKKWLESMDSVFNWEKDTLIVTQTDTFISKLDCSDLKKSLSVTSSQLNKAKQIIRTIKSKVIIAPAVHDTIVKIDSAQIQILTDKYNQSDKQRQQYEDKYNFWFKFGISFLILLLISIIFNMLKIKL